MDEWSSVTVTQAGGSNTFSDVELMIAKDIPVSGFPHCDLIDVGYYIHAVAKVKINFHLLKYCKIRPNKYFLQTPKRDDDVCVKLPITILFGNEEDWSEEEKSRMIGDKEAFGKTGNDAIGEDTEANDANGNDQEEENVPTETIIDFENETNVNTDVDGSIDDEQNNEDEAGENGDEDQANEDTNIDDNDEADDDMM